MPQREARIAVQTIFDAMIAALVRGEKIELRGFGSFHVRRRRFRVGYNPKTRTRVDIPAKRVLSFRAGKRCDACLLGDPRPQTNRTPARWHKTFWRTASEGSVESGGQ